MQRAPTPCPIMHLAHAWGHPCSHPHPPRLTRCACWVAPRPARAPTTPAHTCACAHHAPHAAQAGGPGLGTGTVGNDPYAVLRKVGGAGGDGFSMTNEDFPALPGPAPRQGDDGARGGFLGGLQSGVGRGGFPMLSGGDQFGGDMARAQAAASLPQQHNLSEYEQLLRIQQARLGAGGGGGVTSAAMSPGGPGKQGGGLGLGLGGVVIGAGPGGGDGSQLMGAVTPQDRFGLLGLMPLLKMSDPNLTMLALGTDLTSLGLNLNSSDNLHKSLVSPLSDTPVKGGRGRG